MSTICTRGGAKTWFGIDLPKNVVGLTKDHPYDDWKPILYEDVVARKVKKQNSHLWWKREYGVIQTRACFIWVFYNKGFPYGGWWIDIKTLKKEYALNFRQPNKKMVQKVMSLYPCEMLPFEGNFDAWAEAFAKQYHRPAFGRTKQGLVKAWCKIREDEIIDVIPL